MSESESLLARRLKAFDVDLPACQPAFDRVFVYQVNNIGEARDGDTDTTFKGTSIIMPTPAKGTFGASRGLLISAGLKALDELYSHGIELGHIVWYQRLSPWQRSYMGNGRICQVTILRAMEIVGSEDTMANFNEKGWEVGRDEDGIHYVVDRESKRKVGGRFDPEINPDDL